MYTTLEWGKCLQSQHGPKPGEVQHSLLHLWEKGTNILCTLTPEDCIARGMFKQHK